MQPSDIIVKLSEDIVLSSLIKVPSRSSPTSILQNLVKSSGWTCGKSIHTANNRSVEVNNQSIVEYKPSRFSKVETTSIVI